jgi:hypothetical protein
MKMTSRISQGERIALEELRNMFPFFLVCNGIILITGGVYSFFESIDFGLFTGLLLGNIMSAANFYFIGYASGRLIQRKREGGAGGLASAAFALRFFGMFAAYWVLGLPLSL